MAKDIEAFERVFRETGKLQHARLAYGDSEPVSRKGMQGLNKTLRAIVERVRAESSHTPMVVMPPAPVPQKEVANRVLPAAFVAQQFQPGQAGNPEGGSIARTFRTAAKRKLDREGAEKYVNQLGTIIETGKNDSDKIRAFEAFRDTAGEKPTSNINMAALVVMMPAEAVMSNLDEWAGDDDYA